MLYDRPMKKQIDTIFIVCILFVFSQCGTSSFMMSKPSVMIFGGTYPPKSDTATIDFFMTLKPTKEYHEFARIICKDSDEKWNIEQVKRKARELGADGIIILGNAGNSGVGIPIGNSAYVSSTGYGITAVALKYK
jgi:hypothetical protein